ncbi:hypothetical protein KFU94_45575 [Chloroflexi bacterium TSY]|nr:hypothetical protein [Chloroflexi bacterium TSY]
MTPKSLQSRLKIAKNAKFGSTESIIHVAGQGWKQIGDFGKTYLCIYELGVDLVGRDHGRIVNRRGIGRYNVATPQQPKVAEMGVLVNHY